MSVHQYAFVACDHFDDGVPVGHDGRWCDKRTEAATKAQARAQARKRGWLVGVMHDGDKPPRGISGLWDYCDQHRPDKTGGAS